MMKLLITFILFFLSITIVIGQPKSFKIKGIVKDDEQNKFAYLYSHRYKVLTCVPIVNKEFIITGKTDTIYTNPELGHIFLGMDANQKFINRKEVVISGLNREYRIIVLEDLIIYTDNYSISQSIVKGGQLNIDLDEMYNFISTSRISAYFSKHSTSPISLVFLRSMLPLKSMKNFSLHINFIDCFNALSDKLRYSIEGKELLKSIIE